MVHHVLLTRHRSVSKANASRQAVMENWDPTRSLTSVVSVEEIIRTARRSPAFSPSQCE